MSAPKQSHRPSGFVTLAPRISVYTPDKPIPGHLIIICTWLGALRKHIAKYTLLYQHLAPHSRILLIESNVPILISSYAKQSTAIGPAVEVVRETLSEVRRSDGAGSTAGPKILLHTFSNGGTNTATQFLLTLYSRIKSPLPLASIIFDSCPAKGTYWKSYNAVMLSLPKDAFNQAVGYLTVHVVLVSLYTWIWWGNENPASLQRRTMVDEEFVGGRKRVAYLYSKEDLLCDWTDVRDHADFARGKGWEVDEVVFEDSGHCAHLAKDETRYVNAVRRGWEGDSSSSRL